MWVIAMAVSASPPKILGLIREDASTNWVAGTALLAGFGVTALLAFATSALYEQQLSQRFELLASERASRIAERFQDQDQRLDSLRRFFVYSEKVSRREFDGYARPLLTRSQAYSWAPVIRREQRPLFEAQAYADGITDFRIRDLGERGQLTPAPERDEYFPVFYTQSQSPLPVPLGFDMATEPLRRETLERSREQRRLTVSPPVTLVGIEPGYARGLLMVAPVAAPSAGSPVTGFVVAIISLRRLMAEGLPSSEEDNLSVQILDLSTAGTHEVLFQSSEQPASSALLASEMLQLADRGYRLDIRPSPLFMTTNHSWTPLLVAVFGGLLSLLVSALLYSLSGQRKRALALVEQRTHELRTIAITDALTGIPNRRYFQERLEVELERAQSERLEFAVIMLDIDHFKRINDQHGHAVGDRVLQGVCDNITGRLGESDVLCRLGGEEFILLCPGSDGDRAHDFALELWRGLRSAPMEGIGVVTASFGVAAWRQGEGADTLLLRADSGVYAAKQGGRDRVERLS